MATTTPVAMTVNTIVMPLPMLKAAPLLRMHPQGQQAAQEFDGRPVRQRRHHDGLGDDVERERGHRDGDEHADAPRPDGGVLP